MSALPNWVMDLIADLLDEENVHPKLFADTYQGLVQYDWCPAKPLERVPADVLAQAKAIAGYRQQATPADTIEEPAQ